MSTTLRDLEVKDGPYATRNQQPIQVCCNKLAFKEVALGLYRQEPAAA